MSAAPFRCRLVVMVKAPVAGRCKTRLARDIGVGAATSFARHALRITLLRLARDPRWETILAVAPDTARSASAWPRGTRRIGQGGGDLGARMQSLAERMPPGPVVIVGSDIPGMRPGHVARAFHALGSADVVFGPATDGGFWLVGLRRRPRCPSPFANVRWSRPATLADTLANFATARVAFTATLSDVDEGADLRRGTGDVGRVVAAASGARIDHQQQEGAWDR